METVDYQGHSLTRWRVGRSTFLALPERGARLINWSVTLADGSVRDVIYWPEDADFAEFARVRGGNPILFPFGARTFDRGDIHFWRGPDGVRRPMPMHGIARQGTFKTIWSDARGFAAQLQPDAEAREVYPYDYEFVVTYRFEPLGLVCELSLKNLGETPIPWCAGHHFYFTAPWTEGATRADYTLHLPAGERLRQDHRTGQLVAGPSFRAEEPLSNAALSDTIHTKLRSHEVVLRESRRGSALRVRLGTAAVPPPDAAFVTWSADENTPYYCIEPWMGPPNSPEHRRGYHLVPPLETRTFTVSIAIQ